MRVLVRGAIAATLTLCVGALSGCLSLFHPGSTARTVDGSYDQAFQATLETLERRGFPIQEADRADGRIETGRRPVQVVGGGRRVEKATAFIERDDGEAKVRLLLAFVDQRSGRPRPVPNRPESGRAGDVAQAAAARAASASAIYDDYLDAIEERVRTLRAGP